jgi:hypothetical protein
MQKFTTKDIEKFSTSGSQKSWLNKFYNFIEEGDLWNESASEIIARMRIDCKSPKTFEALKSTILKFVNNYNFEITQQKTPEIFEAEEITQTEKIESSVQVGESLRQKQELAKLQAETLAKTQLEAKQEAIKLEILKKQEQEEKAKQEALRLSEAQQERTKKLTAGFVSEEIPTEFLKWNPSDFTVHFAKQYYQQKDELDRMYALLDAGFFVILSGDAGTGKSELAMKYAYDKKDTFFKVSCSSDMRKSDLIGSKTIDENQQIKNIAGMLVKAILTANKTGSVTVLLDEANSLLPKIQVLLYGLTDDTKRIDLPEMLKPLRINKGVQVKFIITMNDMYSGVNPVNKPLLDRFSIIKMQPLPKTIVMKILDSYNIDQKIKEGIFALGERVRQLQKEGNLSEQALFTTRSQKATCGIIEVFTQSKIENPIEQALEATIVQKFTEEIHQQTLKDEIKAIFH